ncbi:7894_t:CDS:2 [Entrophospora sp. SA101]|nr:7894_t:CDS:2 [Entrophospora sp. SA101]
MKFSGETTYRESFIIPLVVKVAADQLGVDKNRLKCRSLIRI